MPVLQVADIDFSYGPVQVLFDVNFEVQQGETLALLGTNGAGKSTILRVISGLEVPERGVVRLNGQNITYVTPEARARLGIIQLPGGKGVFPGLIGPPEPGHQRPAPRRDAGLDAQGDFATSSNSCPNSTHMHDQIAARLSGGQQQMLALARVLLQEPEILLIDELSLGLAPIVVERLLVIVDRLKSQGQTMVIVEQSLNVALSIADRAIFLDKGSVRFEGPAADLLERNDIVRAVFFGVRGRLDLVLGRSSPRTCCSSAPSRG